VKVCLIYEYNVCADFTCETVCSPKKTAADFEKSGVNKGGLCVFNPSAWNDGHCPHAARSHSFVYISTS